ncbi:MAG: fibronectin type III domain-containing protein [Nitrospiraceae bacterium]
MKHTIYAAMLLLPLATVTSCGNNAGGGGISQQGSSPATDLSASRQLAWDANSESDLAGYMVYTATTSGAYGSPVAVIPSNQSSYTIPTLPAGHTYFFSVTAYDTSGRETTYSNEVSLTRP